MISVEDFKDRVLAEIACNEIFRYEVREDIAEVKSWIASETAIRAYRKSVMRSLGAVIGTLTPFAGLALTFLLS